MKLDQLRKEWGKNSVFTYEFPIDSMTVFTISRYPDRYQLLRYEAIGNSWMLLEDSWAVSCDKTSKNIKHCLQEMSERMKRIRQ